MGKYKRLWNKPFRRTCILMIIVILFNTLNTRAYAEEMVVDQAKAILKSYYLDNLPDGVLKATTINEMLEYLKDPYAQYFEKDQISDFLNIINMKFIGIGVFNKMIGMGAQVVSLIPDSPALEAGIQEGDVIIEVNGTKMSGLSLNEAIACINGEEGAPVELSISRSEELLRYTIVPEKIPYPTITGEVIDDDIGYIRINSFGEKTFNEFKYKLDNLRKKNVDSFIIDLRNNPGGYLKTVVDIAGYLIGNNVAMIVEDKLNAKSLIRAPSTKDMIVEPVVFLINGGTASAAEVLAAAVRDYKKSVLIGDSTYGKGVAQSVFKLKDGSLLKATTLKFFSPFGESIENVGVNPDVKITGSDSLLVGELLLDNINEYSSDGRYVALRIANMDTQIDLNSLNDWGKWEIYRQTIGNAQSMTTIIDKYKGPQRSYSKESIPQLQYSKIPKTIYQAGDRVSFNLVSPGYEKNVQYRAVLYDVEKKTYHDLWNTKDNYYDLWKPGGDEEFTIGFPVNKPGNYRIKIFVKRAGINKSRVAIKDMECDSYVEEIPFVVIG